MLRKTINGATVIEASLPARSSAEMTTVVREALSDNNRGVYKLGNGVIEMGKVPKSSNYAVQNSNTSGATDRTVYIFNEDVLNATVTGADAILTKKYNDGFQGRWLNNLLKVANGGRGLMCKGFNIIFKDADGNQDSAALETAEFTIQSYSGIGGKVEPEVLDLSEALRNNAFQQGLLTIEQDFWVNAITQITVNVPKGYGMTVNFKWATIDAA